MYNIKKDKEENRRRGVKSLEYFKNLLDNKNERKKPHKKHHKKNIQEEIKKLVRLKGEVESEDVQKYPCERKHNRRCSHSKRDRKIKLTIDN